MSNEHDRLIIRALRTAIACAILMMIVTLTSAVVNGCRALNDCRCQPERVQP